MAVKKDTKKFSVSLEDLLEAGAHFGHQSRRWNPRMKKYIWQARDGVHIFDLAKTAEQISEACELLFEAAKSGKEIVFVGTKRQAAPIIREEAQKAGVYFVSERWLGGTITNWSEIKKRIDKLVRMKEEREKGEYKKYTKKEQVMIDKEIDRLDRFFGGLVGLKSNPDFIFVVDTHRERVAVAEANNRGVKVVGIVDSNSDPENVGHVIPANDDAARSIKLIVEKISEAVAEGKKLSKKA